MLALACACACEGVLGRSVADIMCIACIAVCIKCLALAPSCTIRPWTGLGRILERCLRNHRKTLMSSVYLCLFSWEGFPRQTYIKQVGWKHGCKLMDQISTVDCITIILRQPWEELVPRERTPWHWSRQVKFRPSWLFHKGCLSLHSCQTAMLPHVGKLNSANSAFCNFHSTFIRAIGSIVISPTEKHWCLQRPVSVGKLS